MKRKHQRMVFVLAGVAILGIAVGLAMTALDDSLNFFYSPSDIAKADEVPEGSFRMGGLVVLGSLSVDDQMHVRFAISDGAHETAISYSQQDHGLLPDLFREGQGVIVEGSMPNNEGAVFEATRVLAKHDEQYMPPEVVDALKRAGEWHGEEGGDGYGPAAPYGAPSE